MSRERLTVKDHEGFRASITPPAPEPFDEIDMEVASDPALDRLPQRRSTRGAGRIFQILDELEQGGNHA